MNQLVIQTSVSEYQSPFKEQKLLGKMTPESGPAEPGTPEGKRSGNDDEGVSPGHRRQREGTPLGKYGKYEHQNE